MAYEAEDLTQESTESHTSTRIIEPNAVRAARYRQRIKERSEAKAQGLGEFLIGKTDYFSAMDREVRDRQARDVDRMFRYNDGDHYGEYDENGEWQKYTRAPGDFAYSIPILKGHVEEALSQALITKEEYTASPRKQNDPTHLHLATACEQVGSEEMARLFTHPVRGLEQLNRILAGESARYLPWAPDPLHPRKTKRPVYRQEVMELAAVQVCECHATVPMGTQVCPVCGRPGPFTERPGGEAQRTVFKGMEDVEVCTNQLHIPHALGYQREVKARTVAESSFFIERDLMRRGIAEWTYQCEFPSSGNSAGKNRELVRIKELANSTPQTSAITGSSRGMALSQIAGYDVDIPRERVWMDPPEYAAYYLWQEEMLPDGTKLPANTFLGEHYPNGAFLLRITDKIMELLPSDKNRRWVIVLFNIKPGTGRGSGFQEMIPLQDIVNDSFNLAYSIDMVSSHPIMAALRSAVPHPPDVNQLLLIDQLPPGARGVGDCIVQLPPVTSSGSIAQMGEWVEKSIQFILGTYTPTSGGSPDVKAMGTATGVNAITEQGTRRSTPAQQLKEAADYETLYILLENIRDYSSPEQRQEFISRFGADVAELFFNCDFRHEIRWGLKPTTDLPRSMARTQANLAALATSAAELAQVPNGDEILARMAEVLGFDLAMTANGNDRREAEFRLNKLRAIEETVLGKNPAMAANPVGLSAFLLAKLQEFCGETYINPLMQDAEAYMDVYKDWIFGEEGRSASLAMKAAVCVMWDAHYQAGLAKVGATAVVGKELQDMTQPEPAPGSTPQEQAAMADHENQATDQAEGAKHERAKELETMKHEHAQEAGDADLERQLTMAEHSKHSTIAVEREKAKLAPKPAPKGKS